MKHSYLILIAAALLCTTALRAMDVSGLVTDASGEPMIGVSVMVDGTTTGTITDFEGRYALTANSDAVLVFSYIGYRTQKIKVENRSTLNVQLIEDTKALEEVVVVGYGTQRKANLTGAVGTVSVEDQLDGRPLTNVGNSLQGATPGLTITNTSGRLGAQPDFHIRGYAGSLTGDAAPLILVDGVEMSDISAINAEDIASVSVLKDAASASIYGTRAAFGVILITTKTGAGESGKFNVTYNNNFSWATPTVLPKAAKSYESAAMCLEARNRRVPGTTLFKGGCGLVWDAAAIDKMKQWEQIYGNMDLSDEMVLGRDFEIIAGDTYFYRSWDPAKMYVNDYSFSQQHNLNVSGTAGKTNYYIGLGYAGQNGVVKVNPDSYKRYSLNSSVETEVNSWLKVRAKMLYTRTNLAEPFNFNSASYDALYYLYRWPAIMPYGTYQGKPFRNSITETAAANMNTDQRDYTRASVGATVTFLPGFTLDVDYAFNLTSRD